MRRYTLLYRALSVLVQYGVAYCCLISIYDRQAERLFSISISICISICISIRLHPGRKASPLPLAIDSGTYSYSTKPRPTPGLDVSRGGSHRLTSWTSSHLRHLQPLQPLQPPVQHPPRAFMLLPY